MKIAFIHYSCPPVIGGVEEIIRRHASLFHRHSHEVKVIAGRGDIYTKEFPVTINPIFSSLNPFVEDAQQEFTQGKHRWFNRLIEEIYGELQKELNSFDILVVHNIMTMPYNLPLTYAVKKMADSGEISVVSWNHDSSYFYPGCPDIYRSEPWNILKTKIPSVHYVCISDIRGEQFRRLYETEERLTIIPDGIDPPEFLKLAPDFRRIIDEQRLYEADLVMFQPSRLIPRKNIELGLRVVCALKKRGLNIRYLITGIYNPHEPKDIKYYRELKKLTEDLNIVSDVVFFTEYRMKDGRKVVLDQTFVHDLYLVADILFMPSLSEGFGLTPLEAGIIKLPIACSDIPPFLETGEDHICAFSITDTPDLIADKIIRFLAKIPTHNMYRKVIKNYTWDSIYRDHMESLLGNVIKAR